MSKQGIFLKITLSGIIFLVVITYILFNTRLLIKGPQIKDLSVYDGQIIENNLIEISGKAENISYISLNGRQIFINGNKEFREEILLSNKINPIHIFTKDKFEKTDEKKITLVYNGDIPNANIKDKIEEINAKEIEDEENEEEFSDS